MTYSDGGSNKDHFRKIKPNEYEVIKSYISTIKEISLFLKDTAFNKRIVYKTNTGKKVTLLFKPANYMHLCGMKHKNGAQAFYRSVIRGKLNLKDVQIKNATILKLKVLGHLPDLFHDGVRLTGNGMLVETAYVNALRTGKVIVAMALINSEANYEAPESLLNLQAVSDFKSGDKVVSIVATHVSTGEKTILL